VALGKEVVYVISIASGNWLVELATSTKNASVSLI
jgi:hypothetical protein